MKRRTDTTGAGVSLAVLSTRRQVLGVHGQHLGFVDACGIDLASGRIAYVVLVTPSQSIHVPWERVGLDRDGTRLRLRAATGRRAGQSASE